MDTAAHSRLAAAHKMVDSGQTDTAVCNQGMNQAIVDCSEDNRDPDFVNWGRLAADT